MGLKIWKATVLNYIGETSKAVEGETKVERIVTAKMLTCHQYGCSAVGFRPNTALGAGVETSRNGAYLVNKKQETPIKDVYAVAISYRL